MKRLLLDIHMERFWDKAERLRSKGGYIEIKEEEDLAKLSDWEMGTEGLIGKIAIPFFSTRVQLDEYALNPSRVPRGWPESFKTSDVLVQTIKRVDTSNGRTLGSGNEIDAYYWGLKTHKSTSYVDDGKFCVWPIGQRVFFSNKERYSKGKKYLEKFLKKNSLTNNTVNDFAVYNPERYREYKGILIKNGGWKDFA